jgi:PIN domain nuclease of toxin-antitoxin system
LSFLLDTHTLIWWFNNNPLLSRKAHETIKETELMLFVSAASAFEIALKFNQGKLENMDLLAIAFDRTILAHGFELLSISASDASRAGLLPFHHKDPFDRILIAQALNQDFTLISNDDKFDAYGVNRLW